MKKILFISVILLLTAGCNKDDDGIDNNGGNEPQEVKKVISEIYDKDGKVTESFKYDKDLRLTSHISGSNITTFEYNETGALSKAITKRTFESSLEIIVTFRYSSNNSVTGDYRKYSNGKQICNERHIFELTGSGLLDKYIKQVEGRSVSYQYTYDKTNNVIQTKSTDSIDPDNAAIYRYEYDNKEGLFRNINMPDWWFVYCNSGNPCNILNNQLKITDQNGKTNSQFKYSYDKDGYLTARNDQNNNSIYTYKYDSY